MDDDYIDRVLNGDTESFRYFIRSYQDMAFNLAVSIVKDDQYAEEVVQDAFMKAYNGLKSFKRTAKFRSWFYRIVVNESFQRLKKIKRRHLSLGTEELGLLSTEPKERRDDYWKEQITVALKLLPPKESLVLNLFYLEENSLKEVSEITGWTVSNIKVLLHRARKNLRNYLGISGHKKL